MRSLYSLGMVAGAAIGLLVGSSGTAAADYYGAIAFSQSNGAVGYSYDYDSREGAEERAVQECASDGCVAVLWFVNACGALATGDGHAYGVAWAASRGEAEEAAMSYCQQNGTNCSANTWTCTTR